MPRFVHRLLSSNSGGLPFFSGAGDTPTPAAGEAGGGAVAVVAADHAWDGRRRVAARSGTGERRRGVRLNDEASGDVTRLRHGGCGLFGGGGEHLERFGCQGKGIPQVESWSVDLEGFGEFVFLVFFVTREVDIRPPECHEASRAR
uniref:Uncharacterized protein n=1 Tax=Oryza sativa subsp. japonica TaxID=39947 RepID=Q94LR1_ORYSJ|nr:hypothetical protein [Oryza sativa Japonica Group]